MFHDKDSRGALAYLALAGELIRRDEEAALGASGDAIAGRVASGSRTSGTSQTPRSGLSSGPVDSARQVAQDPFQRRTWPTFSSPTPDDAKIARLFADAFQSVGLTVWWDDALRSGEAFDESIERALREAKAVVVLWSTSSVTSRWVRAEATQADRNRTLVPVMIEACQRPIIFELTHTADLSHWHGNNEDKAWQGLVADVLRLIEAQTAPRSLQSGATLPSATTSMPSPPVPPARPGVVILPFVNMSGDPEQEYFSDGVTEDIITDLGRVSGLSVASRNSRSHTRARLSHRPRSRRR